MHFKNIFKKEIFLKHEKYFLKRCNVAIINILKKKEVRN